MKDKILTIIFIICIYSLSLIIIFTKDKELSKYERRKLLTRESLSSSFTENIDTYLSDQFPLRDKLISLNSLYERKLLNIKDSKSAYIYDDFIIEKNYPLDEKSLENYIEKINYISEKYFPNNIINHVVIPDKSYFLTDEYLKLDFEYLFKQVKKNIKINHIDITPYLTLNDYYKTDIHLKQDSYLKIIEKLSEELNFNYRNFNYKTNNYDKFLGASYSKAPMYKKYDTLSYLTNDYMDNVKVSHLEYDNNKIYETKELESLDAYNVFLKGPSAIIEIENEYSQTDKEIIIFRDSFASSLAPLLIPYYKKITLIDLRYIRLDLIKNYLDINNQEILFIYSTLIINNSSILKVN